MSPAAPITAHVDFCPTCTQGVGKQTAHDVISPKVSCGAGDDNKHGGAQTGLHSEANADAVLLDDSEPNGVARGEGVEDSAGQQTFASTLTPVWKEHVYRDASPAVAERTDIHAPARAVSTQHAPLHDTAAHVQPDFTRIRKVCERGTYATANIDLRPVVMCNYKRENWPDVAPGAFPVSTVRIYEAVKATGMPNALGARIRVPFRLNIEGWERRLSHIGGRGQLMDFINYGFPLGYLGPASDTLGVDNHPSATQYPVQVDDFIRKELQKGGGGGPFSQPSFYTMVPCLPAHVSP